MSTHIPTESFLTNRAANCASFAERQSLTPELVEHYVRLGHRLRAEALAGAARRTAAWLRRGLRRSQRRASHREPVPADALDILASDLRSPLTAIRSSAEILRDNPDIDPAKRERFVAVVLAEEARLEALVVRMLEVADIKRGSQVWQLQLDKLNLGHSGAGGVPR